jgi:hypothetical protein
MTTDDAIEELGFAAYWAMRKKRSWEKGLMPSEAGNPCPEGWGDAFKHEAHEECMARASMHVTYTKSPASERGGE